MAFLRTQKHNLSYPAGWSPGVNAFHVALNGAKLLLSTVMVKGNHIDLTTGGQGGTFTGAPTPTVFAETGPLLKFTVATTQATRFARKPAVTMTSFTTAAIFVADVTTATGCCLINLNNAVTTGPFFYCDTNGSGWGDNGFGSVDLQSAFTFITGRPYFFAGSTNRTVGNFVAVQLDTGKIQFVANRAGAPLSVTATGTTWTVGNFADGTTPYTNGVAATMWTSGDLLSMRDLLQWAIDPWSFWYPDIGIDDFSVGAPASTFTYFDMITDDPPTGLFKREARAHD